MCQESLLQAEDLRTPTCICPSSDVTSFPGAEAENSGRTEGGPWQLPPALSPVCPHCDPQALCVLRHQVLLLPNTQIWA